MHTIFMNSEISKTFDPHSLLLNYTDKISLRWKDKYIPLPNLSIHYTWKKSYKNNKFKISAPTWNEVIELPDGSYSISNIQGYFEYIFKKHGEKTINPSIKICIKQKIEWLAKWLSRCEYLSVRCIYLMQVTWQEHTVKSTVQISTHNTAQSFGQFG